jgi:Peptidoglycan-binding protein, CsiV
MRYYDVEIVVIENMSAQQKNSENWPLQVNLTKDEKTVELGKPVLSEWLPEGVDLKASYKKLNSSHYKLSEYIKKINESETQRVIFHTAWRQPGLDKNTALPIYFKHDVPAPPPIVEDENASTQNIEQMEQTAIKTTPSVLEGILRVTLARYLHLEAELTFQNKLPELAVTDNPFSVLDNQSERDKIEKQGVIHLKQKRRRMRSNELHYLDHPVLGILINITQYEKPEEEIVTIKK